MDVSEKEAFRLGFLTRCAEEGLHGDALDGRIKAAAEMEKTALTPLLVGGALLGAGGLGLSALGGSSVGQHFGNAVSGAGALMGIAPAAGLLGGAALGYGAARITEPNVTDDDIKAQELADTYRIYANRMRANRKARRYRPAN
jgi:hypothetical protein